MSNSDDQLHPAPGPSYNFTVRGTSNYPIQHVEYSVDLYDKTIFMVYQNAAMDLVALAMAKLGQVFGEYDITGDIDRTRKGVEALSRALNEVQP